MKTYFKIFFFFGAPFGLIMAGIAAIFTWEYDWWLATWIGALTGGIMSAILGTYDVISKRIHRVPLKQGVKKHHALSLPFAYDQAFEYCVEALSELHEPEIQMKDEEKGFIEAKTGQTMESWGEIITIQLETVNEHETNVTITSKPSYSLTIVDYGVNALNVKQLTAYLEKNKQVGM
ncbi:hypothetical protein [Metabacillus iocasae]|uniref:Uncharacterized protein n=1 Tax=Priestia iocasae TaxID=2291674 RepID=A0ABS2QU95_9BACI|nr:hypothetical protein [Metabacillus iocasae]MBM7702863.1 hypothetical protein [Metabacillus iocasae]